MLQKDKKFAKKNSPGPE